jgi:hypothetical protein
VNLSLIISESNNLVLQYVGKLQINNGYLLIATGYRIIPPRKNVERNTWLSKTRVFWITEDGQYSLEKEWDFTLSTPNSFVLHNGFIYFGKNKMVSRVELETRELTF